jgi:hypothetical protein
VTDRPPSRLSWLQPIPAPRPLPDGYDRHDPKATEQRAALAAVLDGLDVVAVGYRGLVDGLLALGRTDIALARLAEGHVDALRILAQAERQPVTNVWYGVWASRSQQTGLRAESGPDGLRIDGTLRFASGAGVLDRALIPVWLPDGSHLLLDLDVTALPVDPTVWRTAAMQASRSYELTVAGVRVGRDAVVGEPDFYLGRPGFFPGGVGVAACWAGGAAQVLDLLRARHPRPTDAQQLRLGRMRTELVAAVAAVRSAADVLDRPDLITDLQQVATEARAVTAEAVRRLLAEARLVTGPAGLALDDGISHAVPDLELYVLQQNSDADAALLGDPERQP